MPTVKCTIFFASNRYSWSESLYSQTDFSNLSDAYVQATQLTNRRAALMGVGASIQEVRLTYAPDPLVSQTLSRLSLLLAAGDYNSVYTPPGAQYADGGLADEAYSAMIIRFQDNAGNRKLTYLSGYPDLLVTTRQGGGTDVRLTTDWQTNLDTWRTNVKAAWGWRGQKKPVDGVAPIPVLGAIYSGGAGSDVIVEVSLGTQPTIGTGRKIQVTGFPHIYGAAKQINRLWTISDQGAQSGTRYGFTLLGSAGIDLSKYLRFGGIKVQQFRTFIPTTIVVEGATHRKRGVRTNAPRGRSQAAR